MKTQVFAIIALVWMLGCLTAAVFAFIAWQPLLVFGLVVAALAPAPFMGGPDA